MKTGNESDRVICSSPIDVGVLTDYWLGALAGSDEEAVELHLLDCDRCGDRLREVIALAEGLRGLAREGSLRMVVSDTFIRRAREEGLRVREYAHSPGGSVACTVTADDNLLIARLAANLSGARRVDLCVCDERGVEQLRLPDIPVHSGAKSVAFQESITFAKAAPTYTILVRLVTVDSAGGEQLLGEYRFNHTRSLPGPLTW
jgi:hypothetical protein